MSDMNKNEDNIEQTKAVPKAETAQAVKHRRRRSDRYNTQEDQTETDSRENAGKQYTDQPVLQAESETAREIARRFQLEERDGREIGGQIRPAQRTSSRAGMAAVSRQSGSGNSQRFSVSAENRESFGRNREQVGYAPGRMGVAGNAARGHMSEESRARLAEENRNPAGNYGSSRREGSPSYGNRPVKTNDSDYRTSDVRTQGSRISTKPDVQKQDQEGMRRRGRLSLVLTVVLLILGALMISFLMVPEDTEGLFGTVKRMLTGAGKESKDSFGQVLVFSAEGEENAVAPADISFTIATEGNVANIRLMDALGQEIPAVPETGNETSPNLWMLRWHLEEGWEGVVGLQILVGEEWMDTGRSLDIRVLDTPVETENPETPESVVFTTEEPVQQTNTGAETAIKEETPTKDVTENRDEKPDMISEYEEEQIKDAGKDEDIPETEIPDENEKQEAEGVDSGILSGEEFDEDDPERTKIKTGEEAAEEAEDENGNIISEGTTEKTDTETEEGGVRAEAGAEKPEPETTTVPEEEKAKLTVSAAESADPSLISTVQIYNGTKKVKEYARASSDQIQMPVLGEYTRTKMGILTFRTDAFRQNAAIGTVAGTNELELAWTAEAGSAKGASGSMYYGVGWVGQPAIIKWSKEVRELSEMYDGKKEKTGLREVIVAGQDGRIYFLDLSDGTATRNSIKLGYPMKGTPSVHPSGAPYMTVGQFARKMARGTGTIGLRQYNLYTLKEMSLIDGLDAKNNRPFNNIGSFETSALIDRKTGTLVTAGTNGLLYVVKLNPEFDYAAGVYQQSPTQVLLRTKAKGEKDASTAVEASVAMYDRYVYYADMGGFLRCVDTNSMTVSWAVALGDSVESTPALDWHGEEGLDLYTATELSIRKKGDAEIKCFDALSGEERWTAAFGVKKDTKGKTVSGFRASPVVGQNGLKDYIYYTINNLNDEGRERLNLSESADSAVFALRKTDGRVVWSFGFAGSGYSSPVAVYDENGQGAVIQCTGNGTVVMLDGLNGTEKATLQIDGTIEASPAVYNNIMVIATTEKNKNNIYGIHIQ